MISYVRVKNFRSVVDATMDLRYDEGKAPNGYKKSPRLPFLKEDGCAERLVPCLALFGANANGKTNLLRAVAALQVAIANSRIDIRQTYDPNRIVTCPEETEFVIGFVKDKAVYEYALSYTGGGIIAERLLCDGKVLFALDEHGGDFKRIATKKPYTAKAIEEIYNVECCDGDGHWIRPFLNTLGHRYAGLNAEAAAAFGVIAKETHVFIGGAETNVLPLAVDQLCGVMGCDQKTALAAIVEVIRKLDVEIKGIDIVERDATATPPVNGLDIVRRNNMTMQETRLFITSSHENDRKERVVFDFMTQESSGTIRLASVVAYLLCAIHNGDTIIIDELDRSLHPLLARAMLSLFQQRARNTKNAQLVFTTHCTDLLDDEILRLSEIGIVIKNARLGTKVKRLCDLRRDGEDIRNVSNFRRRYLDGFYSGVPYPAL